MRPPVVRPDNPRSFTSRAPEWLPAVLLLAVYLFQTLPSLTRPALNLDEAADGIVSRYIGQKDSEGPKPLLMDYVVAAGRIWPVVPEPYVGAVAAYFIFPFLKIFGAGVLAIRLASLMISCLTVFFFYKFTSRVFGSKTAFLAGLLAVTNLHFVLYGRMAFHREEIQLLMPLFGALYFLTRFAESGSAACLCWTAGLLGLGLSMKITFLWYIAALAPALFLLRRRVRWRTVRPRHWVFVVGAFALGSGCVVHYNLVNPNPRFPTEKLLVSSFLGTPMPGGRLEVDNLTYFSNLKIRASQLFEMVQERLPSPRRESWGVRRTGAAERLSPVVGLFMLAGLIAGFLVWYFREASQERDWAMALCGFYGAVFLLTPFTVSRHDPGHLMVLFPFFQLATAWSLQSLGEKMKGRAAWAALGLVLGPLLAFHSAMNIHCVSEMRRTGGAGRWSDAVYELTDYLKADNAAFPVMFGPGLSETVDFLSGGAVVPVLYSSDHPEPLEAVYRRASTGGAPFYFIWMNSEFESRSHRDRFEAFARGDGRTISLEKIFNNRVQEPVYWLYKIQ